MTAERPPGRTPPATLAAYAAPAFAFSIPTIPVYIYLPAVYADDLGLGLAATGAAIVIARAFDTLSDPVVGLMSDRLNTRYGLRKPWMVAGGVVAALGLLLIAFPPRHVGAVYLASALVALFAGWTAVSVPYTAWGAELATGYDERTRVTSAREGAALAGIFLASLLPALVGSNSSERLKWIALVAIVSGCVSLFMVARVVPDRSLAREIRSGATRFPFNLRRLAADVAGNKPFLRLLAAWFINGLANGLPAALFILYMTHALKAGAGIQPVFVIAYFSAAVVAVPGIYGLGIVFGKHRAWCIAMVGACVAFAVVPFLAAGQFTAFLAVCLVTGAALGADLILPPALQADVIDLDRMRHGRMRTGTYFAVWSAAAKSATAISSGLGLVAVGAAGFDPTAVDDRGLTVLVVAYSVVPIILKAAAIALLWSFPLTERRHAIIRKRLAAMAKRVGIS
jgi:Na+/melibiose symporter-like transporter